MGLLQKPTKGVFYLMIPDEETNTIIRVFKVVEVKNHETKKIKGAYKTAQLDSCTDQEMTMKGGGYEFTLSTQHTPSAVKVKKICQK